MFNNILKYLLVASLLSSSLFATTLNGRFLVVTNNGTDYVVKLQINTDTGIDDLGGATIIFNYNAADLSIPMGTGIQVDNSAYTFHNFTASISPFYVAANITSPLSGQLWVNIELGIDNFGTVVDAAPAWMDMVTINFSTINPAGTANLEWQTSSTFFSVFDGDNATKWDIGTFTNENSSPLPVELSSFNVNAVEGVKAQLQWETATEVNNYGFEIERSVVVDNAVKDASAPLSMPDKQWEKVAFVEGHGNSNSPKLYSFTDKNLIGGSKFVYRLKQIDIDGTFEYSDEVEIEILPTNYELMQNYPNPFNPTTKIRFSLPEDAKIGINVYNILGEKVASVLNEELKAGFHEVDFNSSSAGYSLATGVYIYTIETKNFSQVKKMILMK